MHSRDIADKTVTDGRTHAPVAASRQGSGRPFAPPPTPPAANFILSEIFVLVGEFSSKKYQI